MVVKGEEDMSYCPFWSNDKKVEECFKDCVFFSCNKDNQCPFKLYDFNSSILLDKLMGLNTEELDESEEMIL